MRLSSTGRSKKKKNCIDDDDNDDNDDNNDDNYRIDESITYLQANSNYKESTVYLGTVHSTYYIIST